MPKNSTLRAIHKVMAEADRGYYEARLAKYRHRTTYPEPLVGDNPSYTTHHDPALPIVAAPPVAEAPSVPLANPTPTAVPKFDRSSLKNLMSFDLGPRPAFTKKKRSLSDTDALGNSRRTEILPYKRKGLVAERFDKFAKPLLQGNVKVQKSAGVKVPDNKLKERIAEHGMAKALTIQMKSDNKFNKTRGEVCSGARIAAMTNQLKDELHAGGKDLKNRKALSRLLEDGNDAEPKDLAQTVDCNVVLGDDVKLSVI